MSGQQTGQGLGRDGNRYTINSEVGYDIPVVLIVFNRPDVTRRVFQVVAEQRPRRLMIVADGARANRPDEDLRVSEVRSIVAGVDWPCEISFNFATENMGCRQRVVSGLNWVFDQVEQAVILEDDCLPSPAFFRYCQEMLDEYRDDRLVFAVSGSNFSRGRDEPGHYLSNFALMWGWATWRDRWRRYVSDPGDSDEIIARMWGRRPIAWAYWRRIFRNLANGTNDPSWDYQWILTLWRNNALACRPTINLVENIGFGADATHTKSESSRVAGLAAIEVTGSFRRRAGPPSADAVRDRIDEREWALISIRSLVLMYFPGLGRLRDSLRS